MGENWRWIHQLRRYEVMGSVHDRRRRDDWHVVPVGVEIRRVGRHHGRVRWVLRVREGNGLLVVVRRVCGVHRRLRRVRLREVMAVVRRRWRRGLLLLL